MTSLLLTVEDTFLIKGRGIGVTGYAPSPPLVEPKIGQAIELRLPGDRRLRTRIIGVEQFPRCFSDATVNRGILIPPDITRNELLAGTEIWTLE